jgi:MFS family permease
MTINNLGDWFDIFALQIIFIREFNASPLMMGALAFLYFIPTIIFSPVAGVIADRYSKRNVMIITDIMSAVLTAGLLFSQNILTALLLIFARSSIFSLNSPTQQAYIKQVVPNDNLLEASSYTTISFQLAKILGPILGAVILISFPTRTCLGINVVSFIVSFLILFTLPIDRPVSIQKSHGGISDWLNSIKVGGKLIWNNVLLRFAVSLTVIWFLCSMVYNSQLVVLLKYLLPQNVSILGYLLGAEALGAVFAGTILSRRKNISNYASYFFVAFLLISVGTIGLSFYQASWPIIFLYISPLIRGIGSGIGMVTYSYLIRKESPEQQIGCITGISSAVQNLALATGTLLSGVLVIQLGIREVYFGLALAMFLLSVSMLLLRKQLILKTH